MKKLILIILILLLCGCENKVNQYKEVSDIVVGLLQNKSYEIENLNELQINLLNDYVDELNNPEINVSKFIIYNDKYRTQNVNTFGIYTKNNSCYIRYNDIKFEQPSYQNSETIANVICNGYYAVISHDSVKPIVIDYNNPKYNYRYLGYYETKTGYHFAYRSYYDGSGLLVTVNDEVEIEFADVNNLKLKTINNISYKRYILPSIILLLLVGVIIFLKKKQKI